MAYQFDIVFKNGQVVDPANQMNDKRDIGVKGNKILDIASNIDPARTIKCFDLEGAWVLPGIIDLHVHASSWLGGIFAHKMIAEAGVTTALDMSGPIESVLKIAAEYGTGINLACIQYVRPGHTVQNTNPDRAELEELLMRSLKKGAIGVKILGGHYPLTPESTALTIETAAANRAYVGFHAGSLETKSNIEGFLEAVKLIQGNPVHLAHINSYCRGTVSSYMKETEDAIAVLSETPHICSESYLSPINGTSAKCSNGIPESEVTSHLLGYERV
ncbi:MAG TPA: hypothetical protein ENI07_04125 [Desulfobacterales bacterium]|nr:hypothetical protein [Desulfobacterales bacterium]